MKRILSLAACLTLLCVGFARSAEFKDDLTGVYRCEGQDYKGTTIIRRSGSAYQLLWSIGTQSHSGVGLVRGNYLSSSWSVNGKENVPGIVVYEIRPDRTLHGLYSSYPGGAVATEILTYQAPAN